MAKTILAVLTLLMPMIAAAGETDGRQGVIEVIDHFFDAMRNRDVAAMRALMSADGMIYGYRESAEGLTIVRRSHSEYLDNLAAGTEQLVERYWEPSVLLHGRLATVWTPYDFHVDGRFSHCGINNFSLLRTDTGWIITGVVFSIEVAECAESPLGPLAE
jgi:hypothetical protein